MYLAVVIGTGVVVWAMIPEKTKREVKKEAAKAIRDMRRNRAKKVLKEIGERD